MHATHTGFVVLLAPMLRLRRPDLNVLVRFNVDMCLCTYLSRLCHEIIPITNQPTYTTQQIPPHTQIQSRASPSHPGGFDLRIKILNIKKEEPLPAQVQQHASSDSSDSPLSAPTPSSAFAALSSRFRLPPAGSASKRFSRGGSQQQEGTEMQMDASSGMMTSLSASLFEGKGFLEAMRSLTLGGSGGGAEAGAGGAAVAAVPSSSLFPSSSSFTIPGFGTTTAAAAGQSKSVGGGGGGIVVVGDSSSSSSQGGGGPGPKPLSPSPSLSTSASMNGGSGSGSGRRGPLARSVEERLAALQRQKEKGEAGGGGSEG